MILHILKQRLAQWDKCTEGKLACIFVWCEETMATGVQYLMTYGDKSYVKFKKGDPKGSSSYHARTVIESSECFK